MQHEKKEKTQTGNQITSRDIHEFASTKKPKEWQDLSVDTLQIQFSQNNLQKVSIFNFLFLNYTLMQGSNIYI